MDNIDTTKQIFREHLQTILAHADTALQTHNFHHLVIDAGSAGYYFADDRHILFKTTPHFAHWCPLADEGHIIAYSPGSKPKLYFHSPNDFWHERTHFSPTFWTDEYDIRTVESPEEAWAELQSLSRCAYIGPDGKKALEHGFVANPGTVTSYLDWFRSFKSNYEVHCLREANQIAAKGHRAAQATFLSGGSELDIHLSYLKHTGLSEDVLPYRTITCLDRNCAILHYHGKSLRGHGKTCLIDAGVTWQGYASDITRTWTTNDAHTVFRELVSSLNQTQLQIAAALKVGRKFSEFHGLAQTMIAKILLDSQILKDCSLDEVLAHKLTYPFFPHGLGHLLGIQVHDIGGYQSNPEGELLNRDPAYPNLRTNRTLAEGMVVTVEPGIYFIPMLLDKYRELPVSKHFNWRLIDELLPMGGIRIEDDVLVTNSGSLNLTRQFLP